MKTKTVLISGASIAGPALAYWLNKYGYKVTIVERAPTIRPGGYAVDFRGTAVTVLKRMGLLDEIRKFETRTNKIMQVDKDNNKICSFPDGFTSGELEIMRGDLANILYEATRHDVEYIFNDTITCLTQNDNNVSVVFSNNTSRQFDLVFGADGLHSKVRSIAFDDEEEFIRHLGVYIAIFTAPDFLSLGMNGIYYGTPGKRVGVFGAAKGTETKASFYFAADPFEYNYRDVEQQKQFIRQRFCRDEWVVPQLLKHMDTAPDFYFDSVSQIKMEGWSKGRIALLGDAAHCASPMSGMGTSMAIIGAYILAGELKMADDNHAMAFANYESQMREFVSKCQGMANGLDWFVPRTKFKFWLSNQFWKMLPYSPWKNMMIEMPTKIANSIKVKEYGK